MSTLTYVSKRPVYRSVLGLLLVSAGIAAFFIVKSQVVPHIGFAPFGNAALDEIARYQVVMLGVTVALLALLTALFPSNVRRFARFGDMRAQPLPVPWLGIRASDHWLGVGLNFTVAVTLATATVLYLGHLGGDVRLIAWHYVAIATVFALSNSFIEEAITRFGVVVSVHDVLSPRTVALLSGLLFGLPHYFGTPGGLSGMVMATFLGWLLAKSILETRGVFWAWFIHFVQDVLIYTVLISLALAG